MGKTCTFFKVYGSTDFEMHSLIIIVRIGFTVLMLSFRTQAGILLGPNGLFKGSNKIASFISFVSYEPELKVPICFAVYTVLSWYIYGRICVFVFS